VIAAVSLYREKEHLLTSGRAGLASRQGLAKQKIAKSPLMKKSISATPMKMYGCIAVIFLAGCTTTHVQWDAVQMREQVVDYYNGQIMDNLIRAVNGQPFVHVDVTGLQAVVGSKLAGSVNGGQTETHTNGTSPALAAVGVIGTFSRAVMRPFTFSVSPERTDSLTISSVPAIGVNAPGIYDLYLRFLNLSGPDQPLFKSSTDFSYLDRCKLCAISRGLSIATICTWHGQKSWEPRVLCAERLSDTIS